MAHAVAEATAVAPDVDIKALIRASRRPEATVPICLRGDLVARFEELDTQLAAVAGTVVDKRLNGPAEGRRIAEQMAALQEEMRESTVPFRLRALLPSRWAALAAEHQPRKDADGRMVAEDALGVNAQTFFAALIRASVVSPDLDDADWEILLGTQDDGTAVEEDGGGGLTDGQVDALGGAAWRLNRREVDIPFSRAASAILRSIGAE